MLKTVILLHLKQYGPYFRTQKYELSHHYSRAVFSRLVRTWQGCILAIRLVFAPP